MFSSIAIRSNGNRIDVDWFNALRAAGVLLEAFMGASFIPETTFSIANGQGTPTDVTGLAFDKTMVQAATVFLEVRRKTALSELVAVGKYTALYRELTDTWELVPQWDGDDPAITLTITAAGQVQYSSLLLAGSGHVGKMKFRALTYSV